jgi:putative AlgH/UPF0301 family transcriptional regulator
MGRVGKLLIAHPKLTVSSPFHKSVILIYSETPQGVTGLIINKPSRFTFSDLAEARGLEYPLTKDYLRSGGPVNDKALLMLHTDDWSSTNTVDICSGLRISSDDFMLEKLAQGYQPTYWRMMGGICAWQSGQLEMELKGQEPYRPENSWLTCKSNEDIIFTYDGERQWEKAVELSSRQMFNQYI